MLLDNLSMFDQQLSPYDQLFSGGFMVRSRQPYDEKGEKEYVLSLDFLSVFLLSG